MKVLFDTHVLLDALLAREGFVEDAAFLLEAVESETTTGFVSATTLTDVHYLVGRLTKSSESAWMGDFGRRVCINIWQRSRLCRYCSRTNDRVKRVMIHVRLHHRKFWIEEDWNQRRSRYRFTPI